MATTLTARPSSPAPAPRSTRPHRFGSPLRKSQRVAGYLFVLPTFALFVGFVLWPIVYTAYLSLTAWGGFGAPRFVGFENYRRMLGDPVARRAMIVTLVYTAVTTVVLTFLGLFIAVLVNSVWKHVGVVVRTILFIPGIVSFVVSGVLWKLIYDPNIGTLNQILGGIGLDSLQHPWLADQKTVLPAIIVVSIWGGLGFNMLIFFAGIQGIDPSLYEAAEVDGANKSQQFWNVTVPSLRVVTGLVVSLGLLNGFKAFDIIFVMTGGGPNHGSEVLGTYLYSLAFGSTSGSIPQLGYASAFSVVTMVLCTIAVIVQLWLTRRADR
ncbi:carbohydrate ABC transporter permease [Kribbella sp. VKM Ac-2568]|uniref:carbohydrate ABC transporter permease n=1 Tax=Kribbella sp. VKM Ac-2568 TaxID=2512219 RepID=UPI001046FC86|nr:sugar ABC transporter permease [Kribbella sp. VKM Ac-2568]TCM42650.1 multiple sugar transport system permease protein/raffinose/stachyose/melibiose transport system permease protein [Kribbella sp. VKM Ac-2568]